MTIGEGLRVGAHVAIYPLRKVGQAVGIDAAIRTIYAWREGKTVTPGDVLGNGLMQFISPLRTRYRLDGDYGKNYPWSINRSRRGTSTFVTREKPSEYRTGWGTAIDIVGHIPYIMAMGEALSSGAPLLSVAAFAIMTKVVTNLSLNVQADIAGGAARLFARDRR